MIVGIVGIGCVGGAVLRSFETLKLDTRVYDKYKNLGNLDDLLQCHIVFLCLPTEYSRAMGQYDKTAINDICTYLADHQYFGLVVVKSTVEPLTCQNLAEQYKLNVIHNPEFLSAKTAYEDFHHQSHVVIGTTPNVESTQVQILSDFFQTHYPAAKISICEAKESESMKLFCNCFYSVKIQFFNELYLLCQANSVNYDLVRDLMLKNEWINPMHTQVPGSDGKLSYGGFCFPKDTNALLSFMRESQTPHQVIEAVVSERDSLRDDFKY